VAIDGLADRLARARTAMRSAGVDGWLLYDFQGKNPIFWQLLGITRHATRRAYVLVAANGEATILCHRIDVTALAPFGLPLRIYTTWRELSDALPALLSSCRRVAMDYSPGCVLPVVSRADAGTVEWVRSMGIEVVSSADLVQAAVARWSTADLADHRQAARELMASLDAALAHVAAHMGRGLTEDQVAAFLRAEFGRRGLVTDDAPIVAVNAHAGDPHYEPGAARPTPIRPGDWLLIDLWARVDRPGTVYADSTWVATVGREPRPVEGQVFDVVRRARDAAVDAVRAAVGFARPIAGWEVDRAARAVIENAGYGAAYTHRTGHSIGQQVHGPGVNLDDFETRDVRILTPGVAVTIEPGIYLPEFGVRSEINLVVGEGTVEVTLPEQAAITRVG